MRALKGRTQVVKEVKESKKLRGIHVCVNEWWRLSFRSFVSFVPCCSKQELEQKGTKDAKTKLSDRQSRDLLLSCRQLETPRCLRMDRR